MSDHKEFINGLKKYFKPQDLSLISYLQDTLDRLDALEATLETYTAPKPPKPKYKPFMQEVYEHIQDRKGLVVSTYLVAEEMGQDKKKVAKAFSHLKEKGLVEWVAINHWRVR